MFNKKIILSIAGSDNSSGAGIQADIKTCQLLKVYCVNVITLVTSQNSKKVDCVEPVSLRLIKSQIKTVFNEFKIDAIKIGLLNDIKVTRFLVNFLIRNKIKCPVVFDPIFKSTNGKLFHKKSDYKTITKLLSTLRPVITPNLEEAFLLAKSLSKKKTGLRLIEELFSIYKTPIIIKSVQNKNDEILGYFVEEGKVREFKTLKINVQDKHGTGCVFSAALAVFLSKGYNLHKSLEKSNQFVVENIKNSLKLGVDYGPVL